MPTDLVGRTFVVTGATSGIGRATADALAERGATLGLVSRSESRLKALAKELLAARTACTVRCFPADLATMAGVRRAATAVQDELGDVDVLINNVGAVFPDRKVSEDGIEMTLALNHLGVFTLTNLLRNALRNGDRPRVVTVSSQVHASTIDLQNLQPDRYRGLEAYRQSKLLNLLFSAELHRREGDWLFTGALHPGVVETPLLRDYDAASMRDREDHSAAVDGATKIARRVLYEVARLVPGSGASRSTGMAPAQGALTTLHVAANPEATKWPGAYWRECQLAAPAAIVDDADLCRRAWEVSLALCEAAGVRIAP